MISKKDTIEINFFFGPSDKLEESFDLSEAQSHTTLLQLAAKLDSMRFMSKEGPIEFEENTLIVWPEEFFGVQDNFTNSLWRSILGTNLRKVYVINPPKSLVEQAKLLFTESSIHEKHYIHKKIDTALIRNITKTLSQSILGQDEALKALSRCLASLMNTKESPVVIMLYGPTGVGKTESAKIIASALGGEASRIQFSMFQTNSLAEYLYGSKVNERSFAAQLLERRSNVIILDEFDKTGEAFHSAFYQLFDEGLFVDKNYIVDLRNTLIVCTSNYSSPQEIRKYLGEPLSSRFSAFIRYSELTNPAKLTIIKRKIDEIYGTFPDDIRLLINRDKIESDFLPTLLKLNNVREITSSIEYIMSDFILSSKGSSEDIENISQRVTSERKLDTGDLAG